VETEVSLPFSLESATGPYPEPDESIPIPLPNSISLRHITESRKKIDVF
jgi:hypothetical protein